MCDQTASPTICINPAIIDSYGLHPLAGWLYVVIARHINKDSGEGFPSVIRLAELANMSRASVIRYIKELEAKNLIKVTRRNKGTINENNVYELLTDTSEVSHSNQPSITEIPEATDLLVSDVDHKQIQEPITLQSGVKSNKDSLAPKNGAKSAKTQPPKPRQRDPMYDAIERIWHFTAARNGLMAGILTGTSKANGWKEYNLDTPISPTELLEWAAWYRKTELHGESNLNMVAEPIKIQSSITYWQGRKVKQQEQQQARDEADQVWQMQHPELYRTFAQAGGAQ